MHGMKNLKCNIKCDKFKRNKRTPTQGKLDYWWELAS